MMTWNIEHLSEPQSIDFDATEFMALFSGELIKAAEGFQRAASNGDLVEVLRLCHRMRGSAAVYGFRRLADRLASVETQIEAGDLLPASVSDDLLLVANCIGRSVHGSNKET